MEESLIYKISGSIAIITGTIYLIHKCRISNINILNKIKNIPNDYNNISIIKKQIRLISVIEKDSISKSTGIVESYETSVKDVNVCDTQKVYESNNKLKSTSDSKTDNDANGKEEKNFDKARIIYDDRDPELVLIC